MTFARTAAVLVVVGVLASATIARADPIACATAAEDGQRLRAAAKLRAARAKFVECAAEACPTIIRTDCVKWGSDVEATMPTISVTAFDANLHDVRDVEVIFDGATVAERLEGTPIALDPGPHTLVFHRVGSPPIVQSVVLEPGMHGRLFAMKFVPLPLPPARPAAAPLPPRKHSVLPWIAIGFGGTLAVAGVVVVLAAPAYPKECDRDANVCAVYDADGRASFRKGLAAQQQATEARDRTKYGSIMAGVGAAVIAVGLLWHFLEPTGPIKAAAGFTPWATDSAAGIITRGTF